MVYDFGMRLCRLREKKQLTQTMVAERVGVTRSLISQYESNTASPSVEVLRRLALLYGVSSDYLLGLEERPTIVLDLPKRHREVIEKFIFDYTKEFGRKRSK